MSDADDKLTLLDACAVVNLYATGQMPETAECIDGRVGIASIVKQESLYIAGGVEEDERVMIDLSPLVDTGSLEILSPDTDGELDTFVDFAIDLDDGEAMTLALASHRNATVVTDDRKAIRLARDSVEICSSVEILRLWVDMRRVDAGGQRDALIAVQTTSLLCSRSKPSIPRVVGSDPGSGLTAFTVNDSLLSFVLGSPIHLAVASVKILPSLRSALTFARSHFPPDTVYNKSPRFRPCARSSTASSGLLAISNRMV